MGILNKLLFWRRDDEFDFDNFAEKEMNKDITLPKDDLGLEQKNLGLEEGSLFPEGSEEQPTAMQQLSDNLDRKPAPQAQAPRQTMPGTESRELELINSKLDTIKVILNSMEQRLANIESSKNQEEKKPRLW